LDGGGSGEELGSMIGTRLGPYEVTAKLGQGGMGEVYQAKDFHLGRSVALKVLPEGFTKDPERLARFEREAKLLAQLNHPNIAQIYGFETSGETRALVMELVEGPTLAERLEPGPLPFNESLSVSLQIAQALEEAHEKGIVHRDLKPQNIKASIEGRVKVLDFGLAKAMDPTGTASGAGSASALAQSPTLTLGATQMGVILGTAAYMSPEQAKGLVVDKRADIWAFGVMLFEMLSGRRLFEGETIPETLAGVIRAEIDLSKLPPETPPTIRRLLERCLERDPKRRLRDIGEARVLLERPLGPEASAAPPSTTLRSRWLALAAVSLVAAGLGAAGAWLGRPDRGLVASRPAARFHLLPPEGYEFNGNDGPAMLSPDGTRIAFRIDSGRGDGQLAVRSLDSFGIRILPGTKGGYEPGWSPDGGSIVFFDEWLSRIDAAGLQPAQRVAPVRDGRGASWGDDGTILFAPDPTGVVERVNATGGEVTKVTQLDTSRGEYAHGRPQWLPDRRHFVYLIYSDQESHTGVYLGSLDGKVKRRLLPINTSVRFVPPDLLLTVQEERLVARRIDLATLEVEGEAWTVAEGVDYVQQFALAPVSASREGRLLYHQPSEASVRQLVRLDREGKILEEIGEPGDTNLDLSPDGTRLASQRIDDQNSGSIWIRDLARGVASRLSPEPRAVGPVWSPDGRSVAYSTFGVSGPRLLIRPAAGGDAREIWADPFLGEPIDWSPDGRTLLVESGAPNQRTNLTLVAADGASPPVPFLATEANEHSGRFSPDGRWVAYASSESGREQIFVEPFPRTGARYLVSPRGGSAPRWAAAGAEILYVEMGERELQGTLTSVAVERRGDEIAFGVARALKSVPGLDYEVASGGRELYTTTAVREAKRLPPVLIENWTSLLAPR
jgi:Tol biopolymer transport system component